MPDPRPRFQVGDTLWADLPLRVPPGHEQMGHRPVVVVGLPEGIHTKLHLKIQHCDRMLNSQF